MTTTTKEGAFAYYHTMKEPDGRTHEIFSFSAANPWSHWMEEYKIKCTWACQALALADKAMKEKIDAQ